MAARSASVAFIVRADRRIATASEFFGLAQKSSAFFRAFFAEFIPAISVFCRPSTLLRRAG
jgi:hypothetical protein